MTSDNGHSSRRNSKSKSELGRVHGLRRARKQLQDEVASLRKEQGELQRQTEQQHERAQELARTVLGIEDQSQGAGDHADAASEFLVTLGLTP